MNNAIHTDEPTGPLFVFYTDDGLLLCWQPDAEGDPQQVRALPVHPDAVSGLVGALEGVAADGEARALPAYAVTLASDKIVLLWIQQGGVRGVKFPREAAPELVAAMWKAMADRDVLVIHDGDVSEGSADDFR